MPYKAPAGSVIVLDNDRPAQIMAMASYPTFDNRWFTAGVAERQVRRDVPDAGARRQRSSIPTLSPLTNRAIQGQYNMGSTFKPFTAYAALATGRLGPDDLQRPGHVQADDDRSTTTCCAGGVRCVFRNSTCPPATAPCRYGRST